MNDIRDECDSQKVKNEHSGEIKVDFLSFVKRTFLFGIQCIFVGLSCAVSRERCRILTAVHKMFKTCLGLICDI